MAGVCLGVRTSRPLCLLVVLTLVAPLGAAGSAPTLRHLFEEAIAANGLDPHAVLSAPATFTLHHMDGRVETGTTTLDQFLRDHGIAELQAKTSALGESSGIGGTPAAAAGDIVHVYMNFQTGSALAYKVSQSAFVPSTPAVFLPPPATSVFYDVGGPLRNIKADGYLLGYHSAGTVIGSSIDTNADGPFVPVLDAVMVPDDAIDFVGHAVISEAESCVHGICTAFGMFLGTGAMLYGDSVVELPRAP